MELNEMINQLRRENERLRKERDDWYEKARRFMRDANFTTPAPRLPL